MEFCLRDGSLQTEQEPIVEMSWVIDPILIKDERVGQCADFQKAMPIR
jgi:hypothetical protein